jgi:hypothetical protein
VTPERNADDARNRSDEAVRRLREESAQRVARERHWRGFTSWCALASLLGGVSLAALDAYDARRDSRAAATAEKEATLRQARAQAAAADEAARLARIEAACAKRAAALAAIDTSAAQAMERARTREARLNIRLDAVSRALAVIDSAADAGCTEPVPLNEDL